MDIENLFLKRQSCRNFKDTPISEETITRICDLARLAPSACNSQPWKMVAVLGEKAKEVAKAVQGLGMNKFTDNCPAFIVIIQESSGVVAKIGCKITQGDFASNDIGILTAHIVLAAESLGVGSCILGWRNEKSLNKILNLNEKKKIPLVIALGYPADDDKLRKKNRKPLKDVFEIVK